MVSDFITTLMNVISQIFYPAEEGRNMGFSFVCTLPPFTCGPRAGEQVAWRKLKEGICIFCLYGVNLKLSVGRLT